MKCLILLSLILAGCTTTAPHPDDQLSFKYAGDNWLVINEAKGVMVQAKKIEDTIEEAEHVNIPYYVKDLTVQPGDTLQTIALAEYGDATRVQDIMLLNNLKSNIILPGQIVQVRHIIVDKQYQHFALETWMVRYDNRSNKDVCVNAQVLSVGYDVTIKKGWYHLPAKAIINVGTLTQKTWRLEWETILLNDQQWTVNKLDIVDYDAQKGCKI